MHSPQKCRTAKLHIPTQKLLDEIDFFLNCVFCKIKIGLNLLYEIHTWANYAACTLSQPPDGAEQAKNTEDYATGS